MSTMSKKAEEIDEDAAKTPRQLREERRLEVYRLNRLLDLGFDFSEAQAMAVALAARHLDWHYAEGLLRQGCPPPLVKRLVL